jgi:transcriptional regulator with XRE-family HTH domain
VGQREVQHPVLVRFGESVRARRLELGWSQEKLAEHAGLHLTYVSSVERGYRNLSLMNVVKLADAMEVGPDELVAGLRLKRKPMRKRA